MAPLKCIEGALLCGINLLLRGCTWQDFKEYSRRRDIIFHSYFVLSRNALKTFYTSLRADRSKKNLPLNENNPDESCYVQDSFQKCRILTTTSTIDVTGVFECPIWGTLRKAGYPGGRKITLFVLWVRLGSNKHRCARISISGALKSMAHKKIKGHGNDATGSYLSRYHFLC